MHSGSAPASRPTMSSARCAWACPEFAASENSDGCHCVVTRDAPSVRIHPPEAELGLGIAVARRLAIERGRLELVPGHALAVLVGERLGDHVPRRAGRRREARHPLLGHTCACRQRGPDRRGRPRAGARPCCGVGRQAAPRTLATFRAFAAERASYQGKASRNPERTSCTGS